MSVSADANNKEKLIENVKKEVKKLTEEAVTKKYIHEESSSVTSLCAAVEACLSQGLKRRALGLFKTSSTTALLHKVARHCIEADDISRKVLEIEHNDPNKRSSSSSESLTKPPILKKNSSTGSVASVLSFSSPTIKYLWIRLALFEKKLSRIIDHLVTNALNYYERDSLVADPDYGSILSSLLVGPCALEYTRAKTTDHFWSDPPADELVQRSRISSNVSTAPLPCRRPMLNYKRNLHTSSEDSSMGSFKAGSPASAAKDYVESLHQNSRTSLLYGKNNVFVIPKDADGPMAGYLSLHQNAQSLIIKWTPNQLMNGSNETEVIDKSLHWAYALNINVDEIVYVHCHQVRGTDTGGTIILVGQDGVQRPPINFPEGGHMAAFLNNLETGLLPHGQLDPPLWSQRGIGSIFPWPLKTRRRPLPSVLESNGGEEMPIDYVFRIVNKTNTDELCTNLESLQAESYHDKLLHLLVKTHSIFEMGRTSPRYRAQLSSSSTNESSDYSSKSVSLDTNLEGEHTVPAATNNDQTTCIAELCSSMRKKITSRAFYGWLAYCRHLTTVRTHLSELVHARICPEVGAESGLTSEKWTNLHNCGVVADDQEVYRLVYYGGVEHSIRREVWPYLLGHYSFGTTAQERTELDQTTQNYYETTMSEWLAVEAIVRQRDKEKTAHAVAKLSSSGSGEKGKGVDVDADMENEVFEENGFSDLSDPEMDDDESTEKTRRKDSSPNQTDKTTTLPPTVEEVLSPQSNDSLNVASNTPVQEPIGDEFAIVQHSVIVTNASIDIQNMGESPTKQNGVGGCLETHPEETIVQTLGPTEPKSNCVSPASSNGGVYSCELLDSFGLNLHRIEKDVQRCDRNYWYFANENLDKLRNVICTYVWEHLEVGYMQGMCDLAAPLLVIFDDEALSYGCFCRFMERMIENFPIGCAMDMHFGNMRSLIQILDSEMYELMQAHGDYTHFYFCYRWFLLDFKRELVYNDVFTTWETIWAAKHISSSHFVLFLALALLETYRDIILSNGMDFTDIIKFFNEMAEKHDALKVLSLARSLVHQLQTIIENK